MKCKHCQKKVFTLRGGLCGPCKRLWGEQYQAEGKQAQDRIKELELELIKIEWQVHGRGRGRTEEEAERYRELYAELRELSPKYRGKTFSEAF